MDLKVRSTETYCAGICLCLVEIRRGGITLNMTFSSLLEREYYLFYFLLNVYCEPLAHADDLLPTIYLGKALSSSDLIGLGWSGSDPQIHSIR